MREEVLSYQRGKEVKWNGHMRCANGNRWVESITECSLKEVDPEIKEG